MSSNDGQNGNPRRLLLALLVLAALLAVAVIAIVVLAQRGGSDSAADSDTNTEASATDLTPPPTASLVRTNVVPEVPAGVVIPDPKKTPGDTLPVTATQICVSGYSKGVRNVTTQENSQVYASYGIKTRSAFTS